MLWVRQRLHLRISASVAAHNAPLALFRRTKNMLEVLVSHTVSAAADEYKIAAAQLSQKWEAQDETMIRKEQIPNNHEWELSYLRKNCSKICDFDEKSKCAKRKETNMGCGSNGKTRCSFFPFIAMRITNQRTSASVRLLQCKQFCSKTQIVLGSTVFLIYQERVNIMRKWTSRQQAFEQAVW